MFIARLIISIFLLCGFAPISSMAQDANSGFHDDIDRNAEDFVTVSLLVAEPYGTLYSGFGHCALRMQCPAYGLDEVYSYEGEDASDKFVRFFLGQLKMGMNTITIDEYLDSFREENRGVRAYRLNLQPVVKQNLWRILDGKIREGMELPYDYIARGCAITTSRFVREALYPSCIEYDEWREHNIRTIREAGSYNLQDAPWSSWLLNTITGSGVDDRNVAPEDLIVLPEDLLNIWLKAKVDGRPLLDNHYEQLVPQGPAIQRPAVTPMIMAVLILVLALISFVLRTPYIDWGILVVQTFIGLAIIYLLLSDVPNNEWNWLIIPFNPLPILLWRRRMKAYLVLGAINIAWLLGMLLYPTMLVYPANMVLAAAVTIVLMKYSKINIINKISR